MGRCGIVSPYFFERTVNTARYTEMLKMFLIPRLHRHRRLRSTWFQQDGATCHTSNKILKVLLEVFGNSIISKHPCVEWLPRSPDLTMPDFYLWGYLKTRVYSNWPKSLQQLKDRIRNEVYRIPPVVMKDVFKN